MLLAQTKLPSKLNLLIKISAKPTEVRLNTSPTPIPGLKSTSLLKYPVVYTLPEVSTTID